MLTEGSNTSSSAKDEGRASKGSSSSSREAELLDESRAGLTFLTLTASEAARMVKTDTHEGGREKEEKTPEKKEKKKEPRK